MRHATAMPGPTYTYMMPAAFQEFPSTCSRERNDDPIVHTRSGTPEMRLSSRSTINHTLAIIIAIIA